MKISVLIAANEAGAHVARALASVRAQAHVDWELIVVEYGSSDNTEAVVRNFDIVAERSIQYYRLDEKSGVACARNRLLELASGDPLAFLDPGDTWTPRHLADAVEQLSSDAELVVSDIQFSSRESGRMLRELTPPPQLISNPIRALFAHEAIASASCVTIRRALAERVGAFDVHFQGGECRDFWLRCALKSGRFVATRQATCHSSEGGEGMDPSRAMQIAEHAVLFYEKYRDLPAMPAALRRHLLAESLATHGRLLRAQDPARAARCFWRAWSLQPMQVQTLGQFALTGWRSTPAPTVPAGAPPPPHPGTTENPNES